MSISAFAAHRAEFTVDNATGKAGQEVEIDVNIVNNQGIAAGKVTLTCEALNITEIVKGNWAVDKRGDKLGTGTANEAEGIYNWYYTDEIAANGVYCTYVATIGADVQPGEYTITLVAEDLAGVKHVEGQEDEVVSYKDGEWDATQTATATLTVEGEPAPVKTELKITEEPKDVTVKEDEKATFTVKAEGEGLTYQWYKDGEAIADATSATYEIAKASKADAGEYRVVVTDKDGETVAATAKLTVNDKEVEPKPAELKITEAPKDVTVKEDEKATFTVKAEGEGLTYQWFKGDKAIEGATKATFEIAKAAKTDAGEYKVVITDKYNKTVEATAKLTVNDKEVEPKPVELKITEAPKDVTVKEDEKATFTVKAQGEGLTYQWFKGDKAIDKATAATFEIAKAAKADAGEYKVVITDKNGKTVEATAKLTVNDKDQTPVVVTKELKITEEPKNVSVKEGEKATFTVKAEGEGVTYQWQKLDGKEWKNIDKATAATFEIAKAATADAGSYRVILKDKDGKTVTSKTVKLTVEKKTDSSSGTGTGTGDKNKDTNPKTGDSTNLYIYMALCMFAAAVIVGVTYELKKNRE